MKFIKRPSALSYLYRITSPLYLTIIHYFLNFFLLTFIFVDDFVHLYVITLLLLMFYLCLKKITTIDNYFKHKNWGSIPYWSVLITLILLLLFRDAKIYTNKKTNMPNKYIIGNSYTETGLTILKTLKKNKPNRVEFTKEDIVLEMNVFYGQETISTIWNKSGINFNRIVFLLFHIVFAFFLHYLILANTFKFHHIQLKILFLSSNNNLKPLRISREEDLIRQIIVNDKEYIKMESVFELTVQNLFNSINDFKPDILHFSGHGTLESIHINGDDYEENKILTYKAVQKIIKERGENIKLIILNTCSSLDGAKCLKEVVSNVIGTIVPLNDDVAIKFSKFLYNEIGKGRPINTAFDNAFSLIEVEQSETEEIITCLKARSAIDIRELKSDKIKNVYIHLSDRDFIFVNPLKT